MARRIHLAGVLLSFLMLAAVPVSAQNVVALQAGASFAKLGGSGTGPNSTRAGLDIGASLTHPLTPVLGVQVGAGYIQKGAKSSSSGASVELTLDYVEVPVLLRVGIPSTSRVSAHFLVGPDVAFKAACTLKGSSATLTVSESCSQAKANTKALDFGAMGGVGLDYAATRKIVVSLDALYDLGLASINQAGNSVKNRAIVIRAGVGIPVR